MTLRRNRGKSSARVSRKSRRRNEPSGTSAASAQHAGEPLGLAAGRLDQASNRPAAASAISRAWPRASDWLRSRYSSARVIAWRRSLRARSASAKAGATAAGGATRPSRTATIEMPSRCSSESDWIERSQPVRDLGAPGREQLVDAPPCQRAGQCPFRQCPEHRFHIPGREQIGGGIADAVLHQGLGRDQVQVAGQEVVGGRVGARESGASREPDAPTAMVRVWFTLSRSTRSSPQGNPQCKPGSQGSRRTAPSRRTTPTSSG